MKDKCTTRKLCFLVGKTHCVLLFDCLLNDINGVAWWFWIRIQGRRVNWEAIRKKYRQAFRYEYPNYRVPYVSDLRWFPLRRVTGQVLSGLCRFVSQFESFGRVAPPWTGIWVRCMCIWSEDVGNSGSRHLPLLLTVITAGARNQK